MKETKLLMGMPITIELVDREAKAEDITATFSYFQHIDNTFSTYKEGSEMMQINRGEREEKEYSEDMKTILALADQTKKETHGYFDIHRADGTCEPAGIVKGWAISQAAKLLERRGLQNFFIDAGGDIQVKGNSSSGKAWRVGIRNPFNRKEIIKTVILGNDEGIATSGTYIRGDHIYNPHHRDEQLHEIVSLTVIGPNVYEADRFATAAFAMGKEGIRFIENLSGFEGYMIDTAGIATYTSQFHTYIPQETALL